MYGRLHAASVSVQCRLDYAVIGKSPVVDISQRYPDVSDIGSGHGRRHAVKPVPVSAELWDSARHHQRLPAVVCAVDRDIDTDKRPVAQTVG